MIFLKGIVGADKWSEELNRCVTNATIDDLEKICSSICGSLPKRNGYAVCHNYVLSSLMRCNTAVLQYKQLGSKYSHHHVFDNIFYQKEGSSTADVIYSMPSTETN